MTDSEPMTPIRRTGDQEVAAMLSFRNSSVLSRLAARGGTLVLLGLLAAILAACGPGGGRVGY